MLVVDALMLDPVVAGRQARDLEGHVPAEGIVALGPGSDRASRSRSPPPPGRSHRLLSRLAHASTRLPPPSPVTSLASSLLTEPLEQRDGPEPGLAQPADRQQAEPAVEQPLGHAELDELVRGDPVGERVHAAGGRAHPAGDQRRAPDAVVDRPRRASD